jgi:hypothetical protein
VFFKGLSTARHGQIIGHSFLKIIGKEPIGFRGGDSAWLTSVFPCFVDSSKGGGDYEPLFFSLATLKVWERSDLHVAAEGGLLVGSLLEFSTNEGFYLPVRLNL